MSEQVKILFNFHSDIFDEQMVETVWADKVHQEKGFYKIDNIPFYIPLVASEDIVFAEFDETEQMLSYRKPMLTRTCSGCIIGGELTEKIITELKNCR